MTNQNDVLVNIFNMDKAKPQKLLDQVRESLRVKHYAYRTEEAYVEWIRRFILFHDKRHPKDMGEAEVQAYLTHLAVKDSGAASKQNVAISNLFSTNKFCLLIYPTLTKLNLPACLMFSDG